MLGIRDKAGKVQIKGLGINLTLNSSQKVLENAIKRVPFLKEKGFIIELNQTQIKEREVKAAKKAELKLKKLNQKPVNNGKEKGNTKKEADS